MKCYVKQVVSEQVSKEFYAIHGEEIINFFAKLHDLEIDFSEIHILSYCLGIFLRGGQPVTITDSFRLFSDCFLDGEGLHNG